MSETMSNAAPITAAFEVKGIAFTPLPQQLYANRPPIVDAMSEMCHITAKQVDQLLDATKIDKSEFNRHFLCSTMIELPFTTREVKWQQLAAQFAEYGSHQPSTFINAYECTSWGFSLRHYLQQDKLNGIESRYLMVSIIDANVYNFEFWRYNENWEESGFGITTFILEVTKPVTDELSTGAAKTHNGVAEFATTVRRTVAKKPGATVALPFFPTNVQKMFEKLLRGQPSLPDLHADFGHCFGSDPWVSLLTHGLNNPIVKPERFMACSVALNGYYCIAELMLTPQSVLIKNQEWRDEQ